MKEGRRYQYLFPFIAAVLLLLAFTLHTLFKTDDNSAKRFASEIQFNVEEQLNQLDETASKIELLLAESISFSSLEPLGGLFFVFDDGEPVYWSTNQVMPDYYQLIKDNSISYTKIEAGHYLVKRYSIDGFEIIGLIELWQETRINNEYLKSGFNEEIFPETSGFAITENEQFLPILAEGSSVFFIEDQGLNYPDYPIKSMLVLLLCSISVVILGIWVWETLAKRVVSGEFESSFLGWISFLFLIRYLMLVFDIPDSIMETGLFGSMLFAASRINPSLGDMLINGVVLMLISLFLFNFYTKSRFLRRILAGSKQLQWIISIIAILFALFATWYPHDVIQTIYYNSQVTMDITESIHFDFPRLISLIIFIISAFSLFLVLYVVNRVVFQLFKYRYVQLVLVYLVSIALFTLYQINTSQHFWVVIVSMFAFTQILYFSRIYRAFMQWRYHSFIYIFSIIALTSFLGSFGIYEFEQERVTKNKVRFADYFLIKNDNITEYYLNDLNTRIKSDLFISSRLNSPFLSKDIIEGKIRKVYLGTIFDKYDVNISVFGSDGTLLHGDPSSEEFFLVEGNVSQFPALTEYENIFYINRSKGDLVKRYLNKVEIMRRDMVAGYITMDLQLKKIIPNDVYFELLMDDRFVQPYLGQDYSYAVYSNDRLTYNSGAFNYLGEFSKTLIDVREKKR